MAYNQPQHGGEADGYYQMGGQQDIGMQQRNYQQNGNGQYPPPNQAQYQQQGGYQQQPQQYAAPPPQYGNNAPVPQAPNGKQSGFEQTFKVDKPKYNDIWAALLFLVTFLGFVAVSGLAIHGYASISHGGVYGNTNNVGLNSNTIILL